MTTDFTQPEDMRIDVGALVTAVLSRWLRILVVTALLLGATFAFLLFVPKLYESSASILVEARDNALTGPAPATSSGSQITIDALVSSQIELIKSRDTLLRVVDTLNLRSESELNGGGASPIGMILQMFGRAPEVKSIDDTVLQNLNERLSVLRERDSAIISIFVQAERPQLAADIANAIAREHLRRRSDQSLQDTAEASVWLEQEIAKLRVSVAQGENAVADFRAANDLFEGTNNTSLVSQQLSNLASQITAAQERRNAAQTRSSLIRGMVRSGQAIDGLPDVQSSVAIQRLTQSKADLRGELAQRSSTLLPNHPIIKGLVAQIAELDQQIAQEGRRVAASLEAEAKIQAELEQSLQDQLAAAKLSSASAATQTVTLDELERNAKSQRDLLESYLTRYRQATSRSDSSSALPDVRIVTEAAPSQTPASPKTALILGAVGFVAVTIQVGAILFGELLSGRAINDARAITFYRAIRQEPENDLEVADAQSVADEDDKSEHEDDDEVVTASATDEIAVAANDPDPATVAPTTAEPAVAEGGPTAEPDMPAAIVPAPEIRAAEPTPKRQTPPRTAPQSGDAHHPSALATLGADIALGRVRVVMIAGLHDPADCLPVADALARQATLAGLSVARVDAGSGVISVEPGITDLAAERVSFGDIVHKGERDGLAVVPWGNQIALDRNSERPHTLVEALTDIYEVVIVQTGQVGAKSALPLFAGIEARVVLTGTGRADPRDVDTALAETNAQGFRNTQVIVARPRQTEVA